MPRIFLLIIFSATAEIALSQTWADGYYITRQNDSVLTTIKLPTRLWQGFDPSWLEYKIKTRTDDSSAVQKFRAPDIKRFGFLYKNFQYRYVAITDDKRNGGFFQVIYSGNYISGYLSYSIGYRGSSTVLVRREIDSGETVFLKSSTMSKKKIKRKLIALYQNDKEAVAVIQEYRLIRRALPGSIRNLLQTIADKSSSTTASLTAAKKFQFSRLTSAPLP